MSRRLVILELPDIDAEDSLDMALEVWNRNHPYEQIDVIQKVSLIVGRDR